jgi:hypothetical protein
MKHQFVVKFSKTVVISGWITNVVGPFESVRLAQEWVLGSKDVEKAGLNLDLDCEIDSIVVPE